MSKMNQKEATFNAIVTVLKNAGIEFVENVTVAKSVMSKEHRAQVNAILFAGFREGKIEIDEPKSDDSDLKQYVSGLQSNWLNKDKRLNGGVQYAAKNPGSRSGSTDPQVKALKALLAQTQDTEGKAEIQGYLDARLKAIGVSKAKETVVDFSALPEALRSKYQA